MLVHTADYLREHGHHATSASYFAQEMNWGNAAIGKINSVLRGLEADIKAEPVPSPTLNFSKMGRSRNFLSSLPISHSPMNFGG
jgi:type I restriction enzyme M protein